jgi:hypothetical protein
MHHSHEDRVYFRIDAFDLINELLHELVVLLFGETGHVDGAGGECAVF